MFDHKLKCGDLFNISMVYSYLVKENGNIYFRNYRPQLSCGEREKNDDKREDCWRNHHFLELL